MTQNVAVPLWLLVKDDRSRHLSTIHRSQADDEEAFKKILREKVGAIDTNHLHPATYALFTEMFQKLFSELSNEDRVEITHVIELAEKRRLTDDSISAVCPQAAPVAPKSK